MRLTQLKSYFSRIGYKNSLLSRSVALPSGKCDGLFGFSSYPYDARSACLAAVELSDEREAILDNLRPLGAPVIFLVNQDGLEWWEQSEEPTLCCVVPNEKIESFFEQQAPHFAPSRIHSAKNEGRWDHEQQLEFVDVGLMPLAESEMGHKVSQLIERCFANVHNKLPHEEAGSKILRDRLRQVFWLVGAKILKDKEVDTFVDLDLLNVSEALQRVALHYQEHGPEIKIDEQIVSDLSEAAVEIDQFANLSLITTEALGYIYENATVTPETRKTLGTHGTPVFLVDYIVGRLRNWIAEIPQAERHVYEPGCGHGPFLVAAARLLTELGGQSLANPKKRHAYLQGHLKGSDVDDFALEIARLALTLTDIPNPDGWRLQCEDLFANGTLAENVQKASIVLANPPYEKFSSVRDAEDETAEWSFATMAQEVTSAAVENLRPNGVLGLVLPAHFLHEAGSREVRRKLLKNFEILEVGLLPDNIFSYSSSEIAVILAKRLPEETVSDRRFLYGRVTEGSVDNFINDYEYESTENAKQSDVLELPSFLMRLPRFMNLWSYLNGFPVLGDFGEIGQGLNHIGHERAGGRTTYAHEQFDGSVEVYWSLKGERFSHLSPISAWADLDPSLIESFRFSKTTGEPQVFFNKAPKSRGPWRLMASMDNEGKAFLSRLLCFRASDSSIPLEYWWALLNSPIINLFAYSHFGKRDFEKSKMLKAPIPRRNEHSIKSVVQAARSYLKLAGKGLDGFSDYSEEYLEKLKVLHVRLDAAVFDAYAIPPELQLDILKEFSGEKRCGVPFEQTEYLPDYFQSDITLSELIAVTFDWDMTNKRRGEFIDLEGQRELTTDEDEEFQYLQHLADLRIELDAMPALLQVDELKQKIASGKLNA